MLREDVSSAGVAFSSFRTTRHNTGKTRQATCRLIKMGDYHSAQFSQNSQMSYW